MKLELVSLSGIKYSDDAYEVVIPTAAGEIAVYPHHMPLVSLAIPGMLSIRRAKSDPTTTPYAIGGGVIQVDGEILRILVDEVESAEDIVEAEVQKAYELAKRMKAEAKNEIELEQAHRLMDRHAVRLRVAELHHSRRPRRP